MNWRERYIKKSGIAEDAGNYLNNPNNITRLTDEATKDWGTHTFICSHCGPSKRHGHLVTCQGCGAQESLSRTTDENVKPSWETYYMGEDDNGPVFKGWCPRCQ